MSISREAQEQNGLALLDRLYSLTRNIEWKVESQVDHWDTRFRCRGIAEIGGKEFVAVVVLPVSGDDIEMLPYLVVDYVTRRIADQYKVEDFGEQWNTLRRGNESGE